MVFGSLASGVLLSKVLEAALSVSFDKAIEAVKNTNPKNARKLVNQLSDQDVRQRFFEKHIARFISMRTLVRQGEDVLLDDIYVPLYLIEPINPNNKREHSHLVTDSFSFSFSSIVNIMGSAGQGKTTVLRKLFANTFKSGNTFPIFIELRHLNGASIVQKIMDNFAEVGVSVNDNSSTLLGGKYITLYLDGFDEIRSAYRQSVLEEIFHIHSTYGIPIIVTSRPNTEICLSPNIENFRIKPLTEVEIRSMLSNLVKIEGKKAEQDITVPQAIIEVLTTPVLVTLYYICKYNEHKQYGNIVDFYDKLFTTLFMRHDQIKNHVRERKSSLTVYMFLELFSYLCFQCLQSDKFDFTYQQIISYIENSLKLKDLPVSESDNALYDIEHITSLILEDGFDHYVFIHKSIPEFYAAKCICLMSNEKKIETYKSIRECIGEDFRYDGVINHLINMEPDFFHEEFFLKYLDQFGFNEVDIESVISNIAINIMKNSYISAYLDRHRHITMSLTEDFSYRGIVRVMKLIGGDKYKKMVSAPQTPHSNQALPTL